MLKFRTSQKPIFSFQHTALTDVMFLLMIFFLLTSSFVKLKNFESKKLTVQEEKSETLQKTIKVKILENQIFVEERIINKSDFRKILKNYFKKNQNLIISFETKASTSIGKLDYFLKEAQKAGFTNFSLSIIN